MKIKKSRIKEIIEEEFIELVLEQVQDNKQITEALDKNDYKDIRDLIRAEVAAIFFTLFKKKQIWL